MTDILNTGNRRGLFYNRGSSGICLAPQLDTDESIVGFAQTLPGRILLIAVMAILLVPMGGNPLVAAGGACAAYFPRFRIPLTSLLTVSAILAYPDWSGLFPGWITAAAVSPRVATVCIVLLTVALVAATIHLGRRGPFAHPVLSLLALLATIIALASIAVPGGAMSSGLWQLAVGLGAYFWFIAYAITNAGSHRQQPAWYYLATLHPFWGATATPFGKGLNYLQKFAARTPKEVAVT